MGGQAYRPDIDGLRAIAVLVVIFFHVGFAPFSGGYVGVDVFFVISGFLITRLIRDQIAKGTFSFAVFYARRARRLFPALFFTLVMSFLAATWLFSPAVFERFARSVIFTILSLSNVLFWRESGYFDTTADLKPLLHTWSLSVEEQFYLVWPLTLVALVWFGGRLARRGYRHAGDWIVPAFLIVTGVISLLLTEICLRVNETAAFYLPPFRVSEFAIGGLMVWLVGRQPKNPLVLEPLVLVGLALIAWPVFVYTDETPFPGLAALPPCIGTAVLIYAGTARRLGRLLNNRVAVGIGLISYSLYLVHWPIIVFYTYWAFRPINLVEQVGIVAASVVLATAMYFFVESPFRKGAASPDALSPARFGLVCVGLAASLIVPAASAWSTDGWPSRLPPDVREAISDLDGKQDASWTHALEIEKKQNFAANKLNVLVIGDSHAKDITNAFVELNQLNGDTIDIVLRTVPYECQPYIGERTPARRLSKKRIAQCNTTLRETIEDGLAADADYIVFSVRWEDPGVENIKDTIDRIKAHSDARIILMSRTTEFIYIPNLLARYGSTEAFGRVVANHRLDNTAINDRLREIAEETEVTFLSKDTVICPQADSCDVLDEQHRLLIYDYGHWTLDGAAFYARRMLETEYFDFLKD